MRKGLTWAQAGPPCGTSREGAPFCPFSQPSAHTCCARRVPGLPGEEGDRHGLRAALARVPAGFAGRAELHVARFALHQLGGLQPHLLELAHGLAGGCWAPSPTGVQEHLWHRETRAASQALQTQGAAGRGREPTSGRSVHLQWRVSRPVIMWLLGFFLLSRHSPPLTPLLVPEFFGDAAACTQDARSHRDSPAGPGALDASPDSLAWPPENPHAMARALRCCLCASRGHFLNSGRVPRPRARQAADPQKMLKDSKKKGWRMAGFLSNGSPARGDLPPKLKSML